MLRQAGHPCMPGTGRAPLDRVGSRRDDIWPGQRRPPLVSQPLAGDRDNHRRAARALTLTGCALGVPYGGPGEFCRMPGRVDPSDAETAVLRVTRRRARGSRQTEARPIFYSLPRRRCYARHGVDRPASRNAGLRSCFHVVLSAAWKRGHAQANDRYSYRVFAMRPRGFAQTTRNG